MSAPCCWVDEGQKYMAETENILFGWGVPQSTTQPASHASMQFPVIYLYP